MSEIKKLLSLIFLSTFILVTLLTSSAYAEVCEVRKIRDSLRKVLFEYFEDPNNSSVSLEKIKDLLIFYLTIPEGEVLANCSDAGSFSGITYVEILNETEDVIVEIPRCSDSTKYGECSLQRPKYCYAGNLVKRCNICGCPSMEVCQKLQGQCTPTTQNIVCYTDSDCGTYSYVGSYFCENGDVKRNYIQYKCVNPGSPNSDCENTTRTALTDDCDVNETCEEGKTSCQSTVATTTTLPTTTVPGINMPVDLIYSNDGDVWYDTNQKAVCFNDGGEVLARHDYLETNLYPTQAENDLYLIMVKENNYIYLRWKKSVIDDGLFILRSSLSYYADPIDPNSRVIPNTFYYDEENVYIISGNFLMGTICLKKFINSSILPFESEDSVETYKPITGQWKRHKVPSNLASTCGNNYCEGLDETSCPNDCSNCGNDICEEHLGENSYYTNIPIKCPQDCSSTIDIPLDLTSTIDGDIWYDTYLKAICLDGKTPPDVQIDIDRNPSFVISSAKSYVSLFYYKFGGRSWFSYDQIPKAFEDEKAYIISGDASKYIACIQKWENGTIIPFESGDVVKFSKDGFKTWAFHKVPIYEATTTLTTTPTTITTTVPGINMPVDLIYSNDGDVWYDTNQKAVCFDGAPVGKYYYLETNLYPTQAENDLYAIRPTSYNSILLVWKHALSQRSSLSYNDIPSTFPYNEENVYVISGNSTKESICLKKFINSSILPFESEDSVEVDKTGTGQWEKYNVP